MPHCRRIAYIPIGSFDSTCAGFGCACAASCNAIAIVNRHDARIGRRAVLGRDAPTTARHGCATSASTTSRRQWISSARSRGSICIGQDAKRPGGLSRPLNGFLIVW